MVTSLNEQTNDLSSCSVCYDTFNDMTIKPKYLSCWHTFCLECIKVIIQLKSLFVNTFCFAVSQDKLAIAGSDKNDLFIWSLWPKMQDHDKTVDQPLKIIQGHAGTIRWVCYNNEESVVASCDVGGTMKLWTPGVPCYGEY